MAKSNLIAGTIVGTLVAFGFVGSIVCGAVYGECQREKARDRLEHFKDSIALAIAPEMNQLQIAAENDAQFSENLKYFNARHPELKVERVSVADWSDKKHYLVTSVPYQSGFLQIDKREYKFR